MGVIGFRVHVRLVAVLVTPATNTRGTVACRAVDGIWRAASSGY